jgi:hypothetical protein
LNLAITGELPYSKGVLQLSKPCPNSPEQSIPVKVFTKAAWAVVEAAAHSKNAGRAVPKRRVIFMMIPRKVNFRVANMRFLDSPKFDIKVEKIVCTA